MSRFFITFEGGEGAGKTTLINSLHESMTKHGCPVIQTREPGGSPLGEQIRSWLLEKNEELPLGDQAELLLFLASRVQHIEEVIQPALDQGKVVLCDRFNDSTIAYQGRARGRDMDEVEKLCNIACEGMVPDLTFFLDIDPVVGLARAKGSSIDLDRLETEALSFHEEVRKGFQLLAQKYPERIHVLDATLSPAELLEQASTKLRSLKAKADAAAPR